MLATIRLGTSVARAARALEPAENLIRRLYRHRRSSSLVRQHHRVIADALEVYRRRQLRYLPIGRTTTTTRVGSSFRTPL